MKEKSICLGHLPKTFSEESRAWAENLESVQKVFLVHLREPPDHDVDHGDAYPGFTTGCGLLVVFGQASELAQPGKSAFDNPAFFDDDKALLLWWLLHNFQFSAVVFLHPAAEFTTIHPVSAIGPDHLQAFKTGLCLGLQRFKD